MAVLQDHSTPASKALQDRDGWWFSGVFVGQQLSGTIYAEVVESNRYVIRSTHGDPTCAARVGEVLGSGARFNACLMNGDSVGITTSLQSAARLLEKRKSSASPPSLLIRLLSGPTFDYPPGHPGGLRVKVLRDTRVTAAQLIRALEAIVLERGFRPDGKRTSGAPSPFGLFTVTTELWFHERHDNAQRVPGQAEIQLIFDSHQPVLQEQAELITIPGIEQPVGAPGGLYLKIRKPSKAKLRSYADHLAEIALSHGFNPQGRATVGGPAPCGPGHESLAIWFHETI